MLCCSHQVCGADPERCGDFQYEWKCRHVLPPLDLAHMRTRNTCLRRELVLRYSLSDASSAHSPPEGQCGFRFVCGCARGAPWLDSRLLH